jgi:hypothetical protein
MTDLWTLASDVESGTGYISCEEYYEAEGGGQSDSETGTVVRESSRRTPRPITDWTDTLISVHTVVPCNSFSLVLQEMCLKQAQIDIISTISAFPLCAHDQGSHTICSRGMRSVYQRKSARDNSREVWQSDWLQSCQGKDPLNFPPNLPAISYS